MCLARMARYNRSVWVSRYVSNGYYPAVRRLIGDRIERCANRLCDYLGSRLSKHEECTKIGTESSKRLCSLVPSRQHPAEDQGSRMPEHSLLDSSAESSKGRDELYAESRS